MSKYLGTFYFAIHSLGGQGLALPSSALHFLALYLSQAAAFTLSLTVDHRFIFPNLSTFST